MSDEGPLFPVGGGVLLSAFLNAPDPAEQDGPPYVHTIRLAPDCDLPDCCETWPCACNCHRVQPTHTIEPT